MEYYLPTSLKRNPLQHRTNRINGIHKIPKQRDILLLQDPEIIIMHIGGEVCMRHICTGILQLPDNLLNRREEVYGQEFDSGIGPVGG